MDLNNNSNKSNGKLSWLVICGSVICVNKKDLLFSDLRIRRYFNSNAENKREWHQQIRHTLKKGIAR